MSGADESSRGIGPKPESMTTYEQSVMAIQDTRGMDKSQGGLGVSRKGVAYTLDTTGAQGVLTSSRADSRVRTCRLQESGPDLRASGRDFSSSSPESQMSFDQIGSSLRTSLGSSPLPKAETLESFSQRWPKSGMASVGEFLTLDTLEYPSAAVEFSLSDVLETTVPQRYALSARAAKGILRRAAVRGRTLPPELDKALRDLSA